MRYLLDTNAIIALLNDPTGPVARRLRQHAPEEVTISAIVVHELYFGAFRSQRTDRHLNLVDCLRFEVVPFDKEDARAAGQLQAILSARGAPVGGYDVLIAGQALSRDLILVSRNMREFEQIEHLRHENWEDSATLQQTP